MARGRGVTTHWSETAEVSSLCSVQHVHHEDEYRDDYNEHNHKRERKRQILQEKKVN